MSPGGFGLKIGNFRLIIFPDGKTMKPEGSNLVYFLFVCMSPGGFEPPSTGFFEAVFSPKPVILSIELWAHLIKY